VITYKVGYSFSLAEPLREALDRAGYKSGKVAGMVENMANEALDGANIIVPKAGTKAASKEAVKLKAAKTGSVAVVAGVRYSVTTLDPIVQRIVSLNDALKELETDYELDEISIDLPDWLAVWLARMDKASATPGSLRA
jgi:hypothetical protein